MVISIVPIPKKVSAPQPSQGQRKGKRAISAEDLTALKKRTRSSQTLSTTQNPPLMAEAIKSYIPASRQEEITSMEEAEDSQIIGTFKRV